MTFEITDGAVKVAVTVTEMADGTLKFDINVLDDTGVIGDLNGLFFDLADDSIADTLVVSGDEDLTGSKIDANSVTKVDSFNNVNGEVVKEDGRFDVGVQFGTQGIATDDIQSTSFYLGTSDGSSLSIADIYNQDFAVRLTSVGEIDGSRDGSVKISGTSDGEITDPEPPTPTNEAVNDSMTVSNEETFNAGGFPDPLDNFQFSLLENDTSNGTDPYAGEVTAANGTEWEEGLIVSGSNGGLLLVNADGTVDFSANGEFDYLVGEETANTQFTYTIEGGSTATLDVSVFVFDDTGGGGGGDGLFF
jgi:hypothetical protein